MVDYVFTIVWIGVFAAIALSLITGLAESWSLQKAAHYFKTPIRAASPPEDPPIDLEKLTESLTEKNEVELSKWLKELENDPLALDIEAACRMFMLESGYEDIYYEKYSSIGLNIRSGWPEYSEPLWTKLLLDLKDNPQLVNHYRELIKKKDAAHQKFKILPSRRLSSASDVQEIAQTLVDREMEQYTFAPLDLDGDAITYKYPPSGKE